MARTKGLSALGRLLEEMAHVGTQALQLRVLSHQHKVLSEWYAWYTMRTNVPRRTVSIASLPSRR